MKRRQRVLEKRIKKIADKHKVSTRTVTEVEDSIWKMVRGLVTETDIQEEKSSSIYLRFLGTIFVAPGKFKRFKERIKGKWTR